MDQTNVKIATIEDADTIARFQVKMAFETQSLLLKEEVVKAGVKHFLSQKDVNPLGFYLIVKVGAETIGSLLVTYESSSSWWIQSVYVVEDHRKKGHFRQLFQTVINKAKLQKATKVSLYVQNHNHTAMNIYLKFGMHINGLKFYSYDFFLKQSQFQKFNYCFQIVQINNKEAQYHTYNKHNLLNDQAQDNKKIEGNWLLVKEKNEAIAVVRYFNEFSQWRFGMTKYISHLFMNSDLSKQSACILTACFEYLTKMCDLKVGAIRILHKGIDITSVMQGGQIQSYQVMQIII